MDETVDEEKMRYGQLVDMLNALRSKGLISAQQRRDLDRRWRAEPELRDLILEDLERIMENHAERLIARDSHPESNV